AQAPKDSVFTQLPTPDTAVEEVPLPSEPESEDEPEPTEEQPQEPQETQTPEETDEPLPPKRGDSPVNARYYTESTFRAFTT
ncbi:MAG: hypothetical protein OXU36_13120, partial [Candidatus Poribacteria bacterium]|nr:hypothetical protein [Candidatus Poribacteria bacterium]